MKTLDLSHRFADVLAIPQVPTWQASAHVTNGSRCGPSARSHRITPAAVPGLLCITPARRGAARGSCATAETHGSGGSLGRVNPPTAENELPGQSLEPHYRYEQYALVRCLTGRDSSASEVIASSPRAASSSTFVASSAERA
jgi:hypothetical protein